MVQNLKDAGCNSQTIEKVCRLYGNGQVQDAIPLVAKGKSTDWMVHMLGQAVAVHTDATHGMTLAAVSMAYYRFLCPFGLEKFKRFAMNVWDVDSEGKSDEQIAAEGLKKMEAYMEELGLTMNLKELGVTEEMLPGIVESTLIIRCRTRMKSGRF